MNVGQGSAPTRGMPAPASAPEDGVLRWLIRLECSHNLLSDGPPEDDHDYCPDCGMTSLITETERYLDLDL